MDKTKEKKVKTENKVKKEKKVTKANKNNSKKVAKKVDSKKKVKQESILTKVMKEMKKVRWPLKKEMIKYSIATLSFIVFFALFFALADLLIAAVKMLVA